MLYRYRRWLPFAVGLVYAVILHLILGMDGLWDTANYHVYIGWAAWQGLGYGAGAVAQYHTYLNPVLDMVNFATWSLHPAVGATVHAAAFGAVILVVYRLVDLFLPAIVTGRRRVVWAGAAVAVGATGAMTVSLFGTWTNEHLTALPILVALYMVVRADKRLPWWHFGIVGLLAGVAVGCKLTALPYVAGLAVAVIIASWGRWRWWLVFGGGLLAGYGLTDGLFMVWRWQATSNPLFPFAQVWLGGQAADWRPASPFEWRQLGTYLALPFTWLYRGDTAEAGPMRDPRLLLAYAGFGVAGWSAWRRRLDRQQVIVLAFFATSWLVWLGLFRIYRYLVVLELLVGIVLLIALSHWIGQWQRRQILAGMAILTVALGVGTVYPDWGRRPWSTPFARSTIADTVALQGGQTALYAGPHQTYLAPELTAAGITTANIMSQAWWDGPRGDNPVDKHSVLVGPAEPVVFVQSKRTDIRELSPYLQRLYPDQFWYCQPASSNMKWQPYVCSFRTGEQMPRLELGQTYTFAASELVFGDGWGNAESSYRWSASQTAALWLQLANVPAGCSLAGTLTGQTLGEQTIELSINGQAVNSTTTDGLVNWVFMMPGETIPGRKELSLAFHFPQATSPGPADKRLLALALQMLRFDCVATEGQ